MQAVFLMAGKGSRMAKDLAGPKQLMIVGGKPVIEHTIDNLPVSVDSLVFVVGGPHEEVFRTHFASGKHGKRPITFVLQETPQGTAHAFWCAQDVVRGSFLGFYSDEIIGKVALQRLATESEGALLARRVSHPSQFGVLVVDDEGYVQNYVEKPQTFVSDLAVVGAFRFDEDFLTTRVEKSSRGEYEVPDVIMHLIHKDGKRFKVLETDDWFTVNDSDELQAVKEVFEKQQVREDI